MDNGLIFSKGSDGRRLSYNQRPDIPLKRMDQFVPHEFLRDNLPLPTLGELEVVRHYLNLAYKNFSVDTNFYPLGSCTMKYNPKLHEWLIGLEGFTDIHPYQSEDEIQGALELMYCLEQLLCAITGMKRFSFQASSGAQGELVGMLMISAYHRVRGHKKNKVIIPDSAHGTNPATAAMCGYTTVIVKSTLDGLIDLNQLQNAVDDDVAALMLTNPNTLGLFEENIVKIGEIIHNKGGLLYYDGANFNPLLGITNPAIMGFDVIHLNLHKTFSTPHGSGGPGAGAVGVNEKLIDFLPIPSVRKVDDRFCWDRKIKHSIGQVRSFYGNFSVLIRAYAYLLRLGKEGLRRVAEQAVLNARYISDQLKDVYTLASPKSSMHEVVFSCVRQKAKGAGALDIAKRIIDYNIHPPTMYFPLIIKEALMIEPTETESKKTLDYFIEVMKKIDKEIQESLSEVTTAPHNTSVARVDEVKAARSPNLRYK